MGMRWGGVWQSTEVSQGSRLWLLVPQEAAVALMLPRMSVQPVVICLCLQMK